MFFDYWAETWPSDEIEAVRKSYVYSPAEPANVVRDGVVVNLWNPKREEYTFLLPMAPAFEMAPDSIMERIKHYMIEDYVTVRVYTKTHAPRWMIELLQKSSRESSNPMQAGPTRYATSKSKKFIVGERVVRKVKGEPKPEKHKYYFISSYRAGGVGSYRVIIDDGVLVSMPNIAKYTGE